MTRVPEMSVLTAGTHFTVGDLQATTAATAAGLALQPLSTATNPDPDETTGTVMTGVACSRHLPILTDTYLARIPGQLIQLLTPSPTLPSSITKLASPTLENGGE